MLIAMHLIIFAMSISLPIDAELFEIVQDKFDN